MKIASLYRFIQNLYHNNLEVPIIMTHRVVVNNQMTAVLVDDGDWCL